MALTSDQIAKELQRKRNAGIAPTNKANQAAYNALTPNKPAQPKINEGYSGVRNFFEGNGYKDVGYDPSRKMVTVGGMDALSPGQIVDGRSYASHDALNNALSGIKNREATSKSNDILSRLEAAINKPYEAPQFNYDPATDPAYQSALARARSNASTASGNAMAELNRRGILNSTITSDRLGQIQQGELGKVSSEILPQLMNQAYNRYRDSVGDQLKQKRNNIADLGNLLGLNNDLNQQRLDNQYRSDNFNRGVLESDRNFNYGAEQDKIKNEQFEQEFQQRVKQNGVQNAIAWANNKLANDKFEYDKTQDTLKEDGESEDLKAELDGLYTGLKSGQIDPASAMAEINGRQSMGFITPEDATKMKAFVQKYLEGGSSTPKPQQVDSSLLNMTGDQLLKEWETNPTGKSAGRAKYDWRSWITDPRGYRAGTTYELWKSQYGPTLGG